MRIILLTLLFFIIAACGSEANSPAPKSDGDIESLDPNDLPAENEDFEGSNDSLVPFNKKEKVPSKFEKNQFFDGVSYLYFKESLPIFEHTDLKVELGKVKKGEMVKILKYTDIPYKDESKIPGVIAQVKSQDDIEGYMASNYLVSLPFPIDYDVYDLKNYALNYLHLTDSVKISGNSYGEGSEEFEDEFKDMIYPFENGIRLHTSDYYESHTSTLYVPGLTTAQGFLFVDELEDHFELMNYIDNQLPEAGFTELDIDNDVASVEASYDAKGNLTRIYFEFGDGCMNGFLVEQKDKGINIEFSNGC